MVYIGWMLALIVTAGHAQYWPGNDSLRIAADNWNSFLTEEERLFYQSDVFPFSLAQKGRFAVESWRGLPPGSRRFSFNGWDLYNPLYGAWNVQLSPYFRTWRTAAGTSPLVLSYLPLPRAQEPRVVITHFLDFVLNLSLIDIDFSRQYSKSGRIWLGGHNFLRQGSEPNGASQIQTTSYFGRVEQRFTSRWTFVGSYYQAHNDFYLPPEQLFAFTNDQFKERVILGAAGIHGTLGSSDSTGVFLTGGEFTDAYRQNRVLQRRGIARRFGLTAYSFWRRAAFRVGVTNRLEHIRASGTPFVPLSETQNRLYIILDTRTGNFRLSGRGGVWNNSTYRAFPEGSLKARWQTDAFHIIGTAAVRHQAHSMAYRALQIAPGAFLSAEPARIRTAEIQATVRPFRYLTLGATAFSAQYKNTADLTPDTTWQIRTISNQGIKGQLRMQFSRWWLAGEMTYNFNWQAAFAPRWHGLLHLGMNLQLFQGALRLRGIFTLNYFDRFYSLQFHRLLRAYIRTATVRGPYPIADFRLFASIKTLTLYFVWENMLSTDYSFVNGTLEMLRMFRLGVRWTLWNQG